MKLFKKYALSLAILITLSVLLLSCGKKDENVSDKQKEDKKESVGTNDQTKTAGEEMTVSLPTIQCSICRKNISKALKKDEGIKEFKIDVDGKTARITYDKSKTEPGKIENLIVAAGYDANNKKADPDAYNNLDDCCKMPKDRKEKSTH